MKYMVEELREKVKLAEKERDDLSCSSLIHRYQRDAYYHAEGKRLYWRRKLREAEKEAKGG